VLPLNPNALKDHLNRAMALEKAGKPGDAMQQYLAIIQANPKADAAYFKAGILLARSGRTAPAVEYLEKAAKLRPSEMSIWRALAKTVVRLGDVERAQATIAALRRAGLPKDAERAVLAELRGTGTTSAQDQKDIISRLSAIAELSPAEALTAAVALAETYPASGLAANILASSQARCGDMDRALATFQTAITLEPGSPDIRNNFGLFLLGLKQFEEAEEQLRTAIKMNPKHPKAMGNLGIALIQEDRHPEAIDVLERALKSDADPRRSMLALTQAYVKSGDAKRAVALTARLLDQDPDLLQALNLSAQAYLTLGDFEKSNAALDHAMQLDPTNGHVHLTMARQRKIPLTDPVIQLFEAAYVAEKPDKLSRARTAFALAKVMDDNKQYDRVMPYLHTGNALYREAHPFEFKQMEPSLYRFKDHWQSLDQSRYEAHGYNSYAPIFVTGMPRSGTTLVEQILSSHSQVAGAGETGWTIPAFRESLGKSLKTGTPPPDTAFGAAGKAYANLGRHAYPKFKRITDKSIGTYSHLGQVHLALPNASLVVVRRDPRDNALSIYKNVFADDKHLYSYNLTDIARLYKIFDTLVAFWREELPGLVYEIQYESLIANPEEEARKLLAHCRLDWEDACLQFDKNTRQVNTLSAYQVRQPIYTSSVKGWQRYESGLQELVDALK